MTVSIRRAVAGAHRALLGVRVVEAILLGTAAVLVLGCVLEVERVEASAFDATALAIAAFSDR